VVAHAAGFHEAATLPALWQDAARVGGQEDVFHDPYEDLAAGDQVNVRANVNVPVRPVLLGVLCDGGRDSGSEPGRAAAQEAMPHADVVTADEELMVRAGEPGASACSAAVLALRFDLAALYLGLGRGVLGGPGWVGSTESVNG